MKRRAAAEQVPMSYSRVGGARLGAGRPRTRDPGVSHETRPVLSGREPVHVTLRLLDHVYHLRSGRCFEVVREAFVGISERPDFRVVGLSTQERHLHLNAEPESVQALARGMQALKIRLAQGLNRVMARQGKVFAERYHTHVCATPAESLAAIAYVRSNTAKHAAQVGRKFPAGYVDPYTVGYFGDEVLLPPGTERMVSPPETWLLRVGWRLAAGDVFPRPTRWPNRAASTGHEVAQLGLFAAWTERTIVGADDPKRSSKRGAMSRVLPLSGGQRGSCARLTGGSPARR